MIGTMTESMQNGQLPVVPPPTDKKLVIKGKLLLVLEVIWLNLLILPSILAALFRAVFPPAGKSLKGQVVLVTGAGRGLGRGLALRFAKEGCKVAVADLNLVNAAETAAEIVNSGGIAKSYYTNVAAVEEVRALRQAVTQELGPVDILVNNAGLVYGDSLNESTDQEIRAVMNVNLLSHFWMVREFLPPMRERNSGHVVAIASAAAFGNIANASAYVASKYGVRGFMEVVRMELKERSDNKVKTTSVYPYFINTSAQYVDHWDLRIPPLTIEETVDATVRGVKRNQVNVSVPGHLYLMAHIKLILPLYIQNKFDQVFYVKIEPPNKEEKKTANNCARAYIQCLDTQKTD